MLRSALISALSACLAVCTTLLFQHYWFGPADTAVHQHVPAIPAADTDARRQQNSADIAAPAANAIDLAQALGLGRVLLSRGEPEEAALVYRVATATALSAHDGDPGTNRDGGEAQHGLGLALLAVGRPQEALEACVEAERLDSSSAESSLCVGVLLVETGDTAGAVDAFRRALSRAAVAREGSETFDAIRGRLGGALLDAGEVDEAISVMADDNNGNNGNIAYHLGVAWQTKGETDKAIRSYSRAVEMAPELAAPRVNLGAQLLQSGRLPEAEVVLKSAVELAHDDPASLAAAHANLGAVLKRSGKTQKALDSYAKAVESGAGRSALMHIAKLHQDLGQLEEALEACRRAVLEDGDPLDTSPQVQAGLILESLGDIEEAADFFTKVVQLDAQNVEATTHLAACQQRLGRHHEAFASYLAASRLEPRNREIYKLLRAAISEAERATGKVPQEEEVYTAVDIPENGAPFEKVAESSGKTTTVGAESAADSLVASEEPGGGGEGAQQAMVEEKPVHVLAAEGGEKSDAQDSEPDASAVAAAAERVGMRLRDAEASASELGSSNGGGVPEALGGSTSKVVPGGGAGASVRLDSAEMRRQSESLSKDDDGATTTRGFFGKKVPDGSKDPAGLTSNGEDGVARATDNGAADITKEVPGVAHEETVVTSDDDNTADADMHRDEGLGSPSGAGTPRTGGDGMEESPATANLPAAWGDAPDKVETPFRSSQGKGEQESSAVAGRRNDPDNGGVEPAGGEDKREERNVPHVPVSDALPSEEGPARAQPADDSTGDDDGFAVAEQFEDINSGSGSDLFGVSEIVSTAAGELVLGEGDGIPAGVDNDSPVAPVDDAATLGYNNDVTSSGAAVDELGEGVLEQGERTVEEPVEEASEYPSTAGAGLESDTLTAAATEPGAESTPGEDSDPLSSPEAVASDSERSSFPDRVNDPTTAAKQGTVEEAKYSEEAAAEGGGVETVAATPGQEGEVGGGEKGAVGGDDLRAGHDAALENAPGTATAEAAAGPAGVETDEAAIVGDDNAAAIESAPGPEIRETVSTDEADPVAAAAAAAAAAADVPDVPAIVSEEDSKRARAKAKLGVAKLNQGQTKKAAAMFEKAASIDPGWWGGFYYSALAHHTLGNPEAAAGALVSALGVPPTDEGEVAELAALSSKVLAALGGENAPVAATLKTAMDASGFSFTVAPPAPTLSSPNSPDKRRTDTSAPQGGGGGAGSSVGRTPGMEGSVGGERASGGGGASKTGLEADLADQFGAGAASGGLHGAGTERGNTNSARERRPFSDLGPGGDGAPGTSRGTVPGRGQRAEASPPAPGDWNGQQQDLGGARGMGVGDSRFGDRENAGAGRYASKPDAARRRSWGRDGLGGEEGAGDGGRGPGGAAAGRGSDGRPSFKIDSTASADDILASMGLKSGVGLGPAGGGGGGGGGARTPEDMMAAGSSGGGDEGGSGKKKKGLFGGLWNRKDRGQKG